MFHPNLDNPNTMPEPGDEPVEYGRRRRALYDDRADLDEVLARAMEAGEEDEGTEQ